MKVTNLEECQPRFVSFCKAHNLSEGDEWQTWDYMAWISKKANEFRRLHGLKNWDSLGKLINGQDRFTEFLIEKERE
ncbi:hypothetical protein CN980_29155 [Bacillus cereus]|uniref:Uncharacterized protein n=1 Tax=Bacillus cereus TaxID=1396 RepID=A0A9X7C5T1_BACCE|nr:MULTISPECIES: hypothetical protein [Bacillus cereus group]PGO61800.1 hypothetical protein CN980_29155 [Bacillus cereus]PRT13207.1 hypothetical protein C6352_02340 [Bacillus thuringiensis]